MRTFLAKNGLMNNAFDSLGIIDVQNASGLLDWRGIIVTFVWRQTPFVALLVAGAMAALDRAMIEAARNLGASRPRVLVEIVLPQVSGTMIVDMAFRINSYSDYGTANALGFVSYAMTGFAAWVYLRRSVASGGKL